VIEPGEQIDHEFKRERHQTQSVESVVLFTESVGTM